MQFEHYQKFVDAGVSLENDSQRERLLLAGLGLAGEAGEVVEKTSEDVERTRRARWA